MGMDDEPVWLSYAEAARRVRSSDRTIRNWANQGTPMGWDVRDGQRVRVVELQVLLSWWRSKMQANPAHFYRMRAKAVERSEAPLPIPERFTHRGRVRTVQDRVTAHDSEGSQLSGVSEYQGQPVACGDERTGPAGEASARRVDPLADMKSLRGGAEYYVLTEAMRATTPGCVGVDAFTADRIDADDAAMLGAICAACPLSDLCREFADASKPSSGFWAGRSWRDLRATPTADAA